MCNRCATTNPDQTAPQGEDRHGFVLFAGEPINDQAVAIWRERLIMPSEKYEVSMSQGNLPLTEGVTNMKFEWSIGLSRRDYPSKHSKLYTT